MFDVVNKFVVFILLVLLILSFGMWGIADVIQSGGEDKIAEVSDVVIPESDYRAMVNSQVRQLADMYKMSIDDGTKRLIETRTLSNMVDEELMKLYARDIGIRVGTKQAVQNIRDNMDFIAGGEFNKDAFEKRLKATGLSEYNYIETQIKPEIADEMIMRVFLEQPLIPSKMVSLVHGFEGERREVELLVIDKERDIVLGEPTAEQLKTYYEENKAAFFAPPYRTIAYVELDKAVVKEVIGITEEMLQASYDERKGEFTEPEKREVLQMSFNTKEEVEKARERVLAGEDFKTVALELGVTEASLNALGKIVMTDVAQNQFYPDAMADAVFSAEEGDVTESLKSSLGWHLYQVTGIFPGAVKSYEEMKDTIKLGLEDQFAGELLYEKSIEVEDEIAGGSTLEELAKELNIAVKKTTDLDAFGKNTQGEELKDYPQYGEFLTLAFDQKIGQVSQVVPSADGLGYFVLRVESITETRQQTLEEVKQQVVDAWKEGAKSTALARLAHEASKAIKAGETLEDQAKVLKTEVKKPEPLYRERTSDDGVPELLRKDIFAMQEGDVSNASIGLDGSYTIARLVKIIPATDDDELISLDTAEKKLKEDYEENIKRQMLFELQSRYPVKYFVR